jgi:flagellar protein FliO/FliZ
MQFLTSLLGGAENTALTAILALGIVLVLIVLGVWALKVFFKASTNIGRGRNRRLSVMDSVAIDPKRQLLIVRRDNVEHLILTGGPQDVVVESGIPVETPPRGLRQPPPAGGVGLPAAAPETAAAKAHASDVERSGVRARIERFRDLGRPAATRKAVSLRHTGLMRSVGRSESAVIPIASDKSEQPYIDSATSSPANDISGQAKRGAGSQYGDAIKAEGNQG